MIGVLGGTFDPIHYGHLRTALELLQELGLREVRLIPCREPPHRAAPQATASQRLAMVKRAVRDQPGMVVDERELRRDGPSYTVLTLRSLREEFPATPLCMIVGKDAFAGLDKWWHWREIFDLSHLVVVDRPDGRPEARGELGALCDQRRAESPAELSRRAAGLVLTWHVTPLQISATKIRAMIAAGASPRYLLPDPVLAVIEAQAIYKTPAEGD